MVKIAIVGRPNVGKSTLFNRLAGRKLALVDDRPGVTRDRRFGTGRLGDLELDLIDTAGFEDVDDDSLEARMRQQTERALDEADLALFVIDAREGVTPLDRTFAEILRRRGKPVVLVANKAEGKAGNDGTLEAFSLGFGEAIAISAEHGEGMSDLFDALDAATPAQDDIEEDDSDAPLRIAIVGRPNAGKSTLVNQLIGEERMLTGPEAGITRDAIPVDWDWDGKRAAAQGAHLRGAGEAFHPRRHPRHHLRRGGDPGDGRDPPVRDAGPADRRPGGARGPGAGVRAGQVGPGRGPG
jgi:GTP-binding protein